MIIIRRCRPLFYAPSPLDEILLSSHLNAFFGKDWFLHINLTFKRFSTIIVP